MEDLPTCLLLLDVVTQQINHLLNKKISYWEVLRSSFFISLKILIYLLFQSYEIDKLDKFSQDTENNNLPLTKNEFKGNFPNPFNPSTNLIYSLSEESIVNITIYNLLGEIIKEFNIGKQSSGAHQVRWNGDNLNGVKASSGVYFIRFKAIPSNTPSNAFIQTSKLIMMR